MTEPKKVKNKILLKQMKAEDLKKKLEPAEPKPKTETDEKNDATKALLAKLAMGVPKKEDTKDTYYIKYRQKMGTEATYLSAARATKLEGTFSDWYEAFLWIKASGIKNIVYDIHRNSDNQKDRSYVWSEKEGWHSNKWSGPVYHFGRQQQTDHW